MKYKREWHHANPPPVIWAYGYDTSMHFLQSALEWDLLHLLLYPRYLFLSLSHLVCAAAAVHHCPKKQHRRFNASLSGAAEEAAGRCGAGFRRHGRGAACCDSPSSPELHHIRALWDDGHLSHDLWPVQPESECHGAGSHAGPRCHPPSTTSIFLSGEQRRSGSPGETWTQRSSRWTWSPGTERTARGARWCWENRLCRRTKGNSSDWNGRTRLGVWECQDSLLRRSEKPARGLRGTPFRWCGN